MQVVIPKKPNFIYQATANWIKRNLPEDKQPHRNVMLDLVVKYPIAQGASRLVSDTIINRREIAMVEIYRELMKGNPEEARFKIETSRLATTLNDHYEKLVRAATQAGDVLNGIAWVYTTDTIHEIVEQVEAEIAALLGEVTE